MGKEEIKKSSKMEWVKNLLNNMTLIKWVKKFSADNLLADNALAEGFGIKCNEESISVGDTGMTKLFVTQARFGGKEFVRYNIKQLKETLDVIGSQTEGELIIGMDNHRELFLQVKDSVVVISPLPQTDRKE